MCFVSLHVYCFNHCHTLYKYGRMSNERFIDKILLETKTKENEFMTQDGSLSTLSSGVSLAYTQHVV